MRPKCNFFGYIQNVLCVKELTLHYPEHTLDRVDWKMSGAKGRVILDLRLQERFTFEQDNNHKRYNQSFKRMVKIKHTDGLGWPSQSSYLTLI